MKRNKIWIIIVKNLLWEQNNVWKLWLAAKFWENSISLTAFLSLICYNFMCLFPILLRWQMTQPSSGCTSTSEYKEAIQRPSKPQTHAAKRAPFTIEQPGVVTHSNVCPCTAVKHSWGSSEALKDSLKTKSWAERMEQKPGAQHICLSPAAHPPWFVLHRSGSHNLW